MGDVKRVWAVRGVKMAFMMLLGSGLACAQGVPVLAELFTSEGCSSCPPADQLLRQLDQRQPVAGARIIVLSEHVDYWNQLGWRDPFSSAQFSRRQEQYARVLGSEVYTPQLVVDGLEQVLGNDPAAVQAALGRAAAKSKFPARILAAKRDGAEAVVSLSIAALPKGRAEVWVALADEADSSSVSRGENLGHTLTHVAVVRTLTKAGEVGKSESLDKTVRLPVRGEPGRVVVFLTDPGGLVVGADSVLLP